MKKVIAGINMTIDGFCDHTAVNPSDEIHWHFTEMLRGAGAILYGRITFELMKYWQPVLENPSGNKSDDEFAVAIDNIPKIVFSTTLRDVEWKTAKLAEGSLQDVVMDLKQLPGGDILVGSPSLILALTNLGLIDEYQLCVHPVIAGSGMQLFKNITERMELKLVRTKPFECGAINLSYQPILK
jgi:dihydrofolate reductase